MKSRHDLFSVLASHIGAHNGASVGTLAQLLDVPERDVRKLVTELRLDGVAVCGTPKRGYFIAASVDELQQTIDFLTQRAMHSLTLASRMSKIPLPDLVGQLHLKT